MSLNKHVQAVCQSELECTTEVEWRQKKDDLESTALSAVTANKMRLAADEDLKGFYFNGMLSLLEALSALSQGRFSWTTVKLYYSVYYFLRAEMLARGVALIRNTRLFRIKLKSGEVFFSKKSREWNSDHAGTVLHFGELYTHYDTILSNKVGGSDLNGYAWLRKQREIINYSERSFLEPKHPDIWKGAVSSGISATKLNGTVKHYLDDERLLFVLQSDHAVLGIPIRRLVLTKSILEEKGYKNILSAEQKSFLYGLSPCGILREYIDL